MPLLMKEMGYAYRNARAGNEADPSTFELSDVERARLREILYPLEGKSFRSLAHYREFFLDYMRADLAEANRGNLTSPMKATTDVLRDVRESLREAMEYGGLTPESHRYYVEQLVPLMNRVAFGPPKRRTVEFFALWDAGLLDIAGGPGGRVTTDDDLAKFRIDRRYPEGESSVYADVLIVARLDAFSPETDDSPLTARLLERGFCRPYMNGVFHPGGIDIDENLHPIDGDGRPDQDMWAIGFLVEGPHFYTHALPRPLIHSRHTKDAHKCVAQLFRAIAERRERAVAAPRADNIGVQTVFVS